MTPSDEQEFDEPANPADEGEVDADTNLILDYLSNKLGRDDVEALENRAKQDKDFRYKLADIVLLKGLVMLALEKNPSPEARQCRKTQRLFLDYLKGCASVENTAQLSKHLDECFECELAFERFQEHEGHEDAQAKRRGWGAFWKKFFTPNKPMAIAGVIALVLAAGAFGVVGLLSSAAGSAGPGPGPATGPVAGAPAEAGGSIVNPDAVRSVLGEMLAADATLDPSGELAGLVEQILDPAGSPRERRDHYARLAEQFGSRVERLLWVLAANEPSELPRGAAYRAITVKTDLDAFIAAARREFALRNKLAMYLVSEMNRAWNERFGSFVRDVFKETPEADVVRAEMLRMMYVRMQRDDVVNHGMRTYLSDRNDRVRVFALLGAADAKMPGVIPIALDLLASPDVEVRSKAAVIITRDGNSDDFNKVVKLGWSFDPAAILKIKTRADADGIPLPVKF